MLSLSACQAATSSPATSDMPSLSPAASASESAEPTPTAEPVDLRLVTIGDSIPYAGEDCGGCTSFTTLFADAIEAETGMTVAAQNLSTHDNLTGARLVDRIRTSEAMRIALADADIIIVTIGHNDTPWNVADDTCDGAAAGPTADWSSYTGQCVIQLAARHGEDLDAVLSEIETLRVDKPTALRVTTDYNDVIGWDQALPEWTDPSVEVLDAFHAESCRVAELRGAICVDVYHSFNGSDGRSAAGTLLADDYIHPSASGQQRIADLLTQAGLAPLPTAAPVVDGANMSGDLLGTYHDSGEAAVGWHLLPAGNPFCVDVVRTEQSCLRITRPSGTVDYGPMVLDGGQLVVQILYDEDGQCLQVWRTTYLVTADGLDLYKGICGVPRGPLIRGEPDGG